MNHLRQLEYHKTYMNIANEISKLSYADRNKVGCVVVKNNSIISFGFNGTPTGFDNVCEIFDVDTNNTITKPEVLHAESNAIAKIAKSSMSSEGADLYLTLSPCIECAKLIIQAGIKRVFYKTKYRCESGLVLLKQAEIDVIQFDEDRNNGMRLHAV